MHIGGIFNRHRAISSESPTKQANPLQSFWVGIISFRSCTMLVTTKMIRSCDGGHALNNTSIAHIKHGELLKQLLYHVYDGLQAPAQLYNEKVNGKALVFPSTIKSTHAIQANQCGNHHTPLHWSVQNILFSNTR